jgi:hypothetical protein
MNTEKLELEEEIKRNKAQIHQHINNKIYHKKHVELTTKYAEIEWREFSKEERYERRYNTLQLSKKYVQGINKPAILYLKIYLEMLGCLNDIKEKYIDYYELNGFKELHQVLDTYNFISVISFTNHTIKAKYIPNIKYKSLQNKTYAVELKRRPCDNELNDILNGFYKLLKLLVTFSNNYPLETLITFNLEKNRIKRLLLTTSYIVREYSVKKILNWIYYKFLLDKYSV